METTRGDEIFMPIWNHWCKNETGFSPTSAFWWMLVVTNVQMDGLHWKACRPTSILKCLHMQGLEKCLKRLWTLGIFFFVCLFYSRLPHMTDKLNFFFFPFTLKNKHFGSENVVRPIYFCNTWLRFWFLLSSAGPLSATQTAWHHTSDYHLLGNQLCSLHWTVVTGIRAERSQKQVQTNYFGLSSLNHLRLELLVLQLVKT